MLHIRAFVIALLLVLGVFVSSTSLGQSSGSQDNPANQCTGKNPFAYDNGPVGLSTWCGECNTGATRQAPINVPSNTPESDQPRLQFSGYLTHAPLVIYDNPYNLKINYQRGEGMLVIGNDPNTREMFKLVEFHFHRPSEESIDNHRFPMVLHLVHLKVSIKEDPKEECSIGKPGCAVVVAILIELGIPTKKTTDLLNILFKNFPPPSGERTGVRITTEGLLPPGYENAGYYRYDGSLTTPPCTENVTFYLLKPRLKFSAEQLAQFERRYPSPNARDVQPLNTRDIKNRR